MEILTFLANTATTIDDVCNQNAMLAVMNGTKIVLKIIRILVPIALIVLGSIDIGKAVIAGDEKKIKEAQKPFVKRVVAAIVVFLIPWIVDIVMGLVGSEEYNACWDKADGTISSFKENISK